MKIGIVGSGIAGLTTAWLLQRSGHHVTIFDQLERPGMDAHSFDIQQGNHAQRIDVPSRMCSPSLWPNLLKFYQALGVELEEVLPTQSFSLFGEKSYLHLGTAFQPSLNVRSIINGKVRRILAEAKRLRDDGRRDLQNGMEPDETLKEYLGKRKYDTEFVERFLYPTLSSTVCTCSFEALDHYPAIIILESLDKLTRAPLFKTRWGTEDVVNRITRAGFQMLGAHKVKQVIRRAGSVHVETQQHSTQHSWEFDHFVFATQANHVAGILSDITPDESSLLSGFRYESVPVVVHDDQRLMPSDNGNWSTFNMVSNQVDQSAMCSVLLDRFHSPWRLPRSVFQTINPIVSPNPESIFCRSSLQRPVVTNGSFSAWTNLDKLHSEAGRNVWFTGSYASRGIPLLESAVVASVRVAEKMGVCPTSPFDMAMPIG